MQVAKNICHFIIKIKEYFQNGNIRRRSMKKGLYALIAFMVLLVTLTFWGNEVYAKDYQIIKAEFDVEFWENDVVNIRERWTVKSPKKNTMPFTMRLFMRKPRI